MHDAAFLPFPAPLTDLLWTAAVCALLLAPAALIALAIDRYLRQGGLFGAASRRLIRGALAILIMLALFVGLPLAVNQHRCGAPVLTADHPDPACRLARASEDR